MGQDAKGEPGAVPAFDRELAHLPQDLRWRTWLLRIEAVLFASATPVDRDALARVVGCGASVDLLIADLTADLAGRACDVARVAGGWRLQTRPALADAIRAAADIGGPALDLSRGVLTVLAAIAYHQPIDRDGLADIFGRSVPRDAIARLRARDLVAAGPRSPRRGAPQTFVTTDTFLAAFGMDTLDDLPDLEAMADAGLTEDGA